MLIKNVILGIWLISVIQPHSYSLPDKAGEDECLSYSPAVVTLIGTLNERRYPAPGQTLDEHEEPYTYWVLNLLKPICVKADPEDPFYVAEDNIDVIALILNDIREKNPSIDKLLNDFISKKIAVRGTLHHSTTGHHRTTILMDGEDIQVIEDAGVQPK